MPTFELTTPDGKTFEVDAPDASSALQSLGFVADFPRRAAGMTHEQMVEAYRATKPGDPFGDYLGQQLQKPQKGETAEQAKIRAGGTGSTEAVTMSPTGKAAATFLQGVPFAGEYMDEGLGWLAGKMGLQTQQDATNAIRGAQGDMDQSNPKTATALRIGGGLAGSAVGAGIMPWYNPSTLGGRVAYGAGVGGLLGTGEGAVSGYGSGTDDESRKQNAGTRALLGGLLGTVAGGAAPLLAEGVTQGSRWLLDRRNVAREAQQAGLSRTSYETLTRAMEADGSLNGPGAQRIAAAGPDRMLVDAGPNAETLLDTAIQRGGPATNVARDAIEGRSTRAGLLANDALDNAFGVPRGMDTMETGIRQGSAAARGNAYDAAYNSAIDYADPRGQHLEGLLGRVPGDVINSANRLMQLGGDRSQQIMARIAPDGSVTFERMPDVRQLDYITRALNLAAESGDGAGALGGQTAIGRLYQNLSRDIRGTMRDLVPAYGQALDTAAEPIAARQALRFGETMLNPSVTRDEVATTLQGMSQAERRQAAAGVRSFIDERLANVRRTFADEAEMREAIKSVKDLSTRASREKITALIGQQEANTLFEQFDQAAQSLALRARMGANSATYVRTTTGKMVDDATNGGVAGAVRSGEPINATKRITQALLGGTDADNLARSDRVWTEISTALTRGNPQQLLGNLQRIAAQNPRNAALARTIGGLLGYPIAAPLAYQSGTQGLLDRGR